MVTLSTILGNIKQRNKTKRIWVSDLRAHDKEANRFHFLKNKKSHHRCINWHSKVVTNQSSRSYKNPRWSTPEKQKENKICETEWLACSLSRLNTMSLNSHKYFYHWILQSWNWIKHIQIQSDHFVVLKIPSEETLLSLLWLTHSRKCTGPGFMALPGVHAEGRGISACYAILTSWRSVENPGKPA